MLRSYDISFLKHFSIVIAALVVIAVVLIVLASWIYEGQPREEHVALVDAASERIQPVGAVYAGETGAAAMAAAAEAARQAAASQVAYGGTLDGEVIYNNLCGTCHNAGAAGAPPLTQAAWAPRVAKGTDTLIQNAIDGFQGDAGIMPPKGGNPALTDEQVEASVRWMIDQVR